GNRAVAFFLEAREEPPQPGGLGAGNQAEVASTGPIARITVVDQLGVHERTDDALEPGMPRDRARRAAADHGRAEQHHPAGTLRIRELEIAAQHDAAQAVPD